MFGKIVVGIDGQDGGLDALALARVLAGPKTQVIAVNAFPCDPTPARGSVVGYEELMRADSMTMLRKAADGDDTVVLRAIADLSPARALHQEAEREGADLIVTGSCRRGGIGRILLGDVSRSTLHGAPCAVAIAPTDFRLDPRPLRLVGVGYDQTPESRAALDAAVELVREHGGELRIVTAVPAPVAFAPASGYTYDWSSIDPDRIERAEHELAGVVEKLDVPASGEVFDGNAAVELEKLSEHVDVLVTGSRGWGAMKRVLLGSTTDRLAHRASCALIVVPSPAHDAAADPAEMAHAS